MQTIKLYWQSDRVYWSICTHLAKGGYIDRGSDGAFRARCAHSGGLAPSSVRRAEVVVRCCAVCTAPGVDRLLSLDTVGRRVHLVTMIFYLFLSVTLPILAYLAYRSYQNRVAGLSRVRTSYRRAAKVHFYSNASNAGNRSSNELNLSLNGNVSF